MLEIGDLVRFSNKYLKLVGSRKFSRSVRRGSNRVMKIVDIINGGNKGGTVRTRLVRGRGNVTRFDRNIVRLCVLDVSSSHNESEKCIINQDWLRVVAKGTLQR